MLIGRKLTARILGSLNPGDLVRDSAIRGFFVQVGKRGEVAFKIQADLRRPGKPVQSVRMTLGNWPDLALDDARASAMQRLGEIKAGRDPRGDADPASKAGESAPGVLTVARMFEQAAEHLRTAGRSERTLTDLDWLATKYLNHLGQRLVAEVKPSELRAEHQRITSEHGPVAANKALRAFRQAYNLALRQADDPLPANPVRGVTFHPQRRREAVILPEDLCDWYTRLQHVSNPLRRVMHELGLFSGLRPGTLVTLERAWVALDAQAIIIPRMKSGREFALPLSEHMAFLVERALGLSDAFAPSSPWLFPARGREGAVIATAVWKERLLVGETGHILRHTYRTVAKLAGVDDVDGDLLLDHKIPGVRGVYLSERALFERLLGAQEQVTAKLRALLGMDGQASAAARSRLSELGRTVSAEARA